MSLFSKNYSSYLHLGVVIGTGSINAMLYHPADPAKHKKPSIVKVVHRPHSVIPTADFATLEKYIKNEVKALSASLSGESKLHIETIHVVLSSPWYFSQTRLVEIRRANPVLFTKQVLEQSIAEEKEMFIAHAKERFSLSEDTYEMIEESLMKVLMNGYEIKNSFFNKRATEIVLALYMSLSSKEFVDKLTHFFETSFMAEHIMFYTMPYVFFRMLHQFWVDDKKDAYNIDGGVLVVDIGGEVTDITIMRKGIIEETLSFGKGVHFIVRRVASALNISPEDAKSVISAWKRKEIIDNRAARIETLIQEAFSEWAKLFEKVLEEASKNKFLPPYIICTGEGADFPKFSDMLKEERWKGYVSQVKPFEIKVLSPSMLRNYLEGETKSFLPYSETVALYAVSLPLGLRNSPV